MSKKACKTKGFENKEDARYECKRCGAQVRKEEKVCKPKKVSDQNSISVKLSK